MKNGCCLVSSDFPTEADEASATKDEALARFEEQVRKYRAKEETMGVVDMYELLQRALVTMNSRLFGRNMPRKKRKTHKKRDPRLVAADKLDKLYGNAYDRMKESECLTCKHYDECAEEANQHEELRRAALDHKGRP